MRATHLFVGERLPDGRLTPYAATPTPPTTCSRRSLAVAVITGASYVGAVIAFALTPWIIQHYGWRQVGRNPACLRTLGFSVSMSSILINRLPPSVHYTSHHHHPRSFTSSAPRPSRGSPSGGGSWPAAAPPHSSQQQPRQPRLPPPYEASGSTCRTPWSRASPPRRRRGRRAARRSPG